MKILKNLILVCLVINMLSCKVTEDQTTAEFTVIEAGTGKPSAGATVRLYSGIAAVDTGESLYARLTDASGKVRFVVPFIPHYYYTVTNGAKKNYYGGYLPVGIFKSQAEIDSSPAQTPAATIGSVKFQDTNGDGVITMADVVNPPTVALMQDKNSAVNVTVY